MLLQRSASLWRVFAKKWHSRFHCWVKFMTRKKALHASKSSRERNCTSPIRSPLYFSGRVVLWMCAVKYTCLRGKTTRSCHIFWVGIQTKGGYGTTSPSLPNDGAIIPRYKRTGTVSQTPPAQ